MRRLLRRRENLASHAPATLGAHHFPAMHRQLAIICAS
jgi:hypothetical protein